MFIYFTIHYIIKVHALYSIYYTLVILNLLYICTILNVSQVGKDKFHKSHYFDQCNTVSMMNGTAKPGIGGDTLPGQTVPAGYSQIPRGEGGNLPTWVAYDKHVLAFDAYFQEPVVEKREEQFRVRKCKLYFYLEDDTIQIVEARYRNSGMAQGTLSFDWI